ncbi:MAG TPA: PPOX class F420-dependent oxidoreductase [Streptosporangiaceae bacterium]|nr:PPOX class F420-dependent oxidoreductase [Streptosporangiaceae bacterium]
MSQVPDQVRLPVAARELFDAPNFVTVATVDPDGRPQLSIVWAKLDGDDLLFSTIKGRRKYSNLLRDGRASALVSPTGDGYRYAEIRGTATMTDDHDAVLVNELSLKYTGQPFGDRPGEQRVIVRLVPHRVVVYVD